MKGNVQATAVDDSQYLGFKQGTLVREHMKEGRKKARYAMFEQLLYLLSPRSGDNGTQIPTLSAETVKLRWEQPPPSTVLHPSDIPQAIALGTYERGELLSPDVCREKTWTIFSEFASTRKEFVLHASYDVNVKVKQKGERQTQQVRRIHRAISILDTSAHLLRGMAGFDRLTGPALFMVTDKYSITAVYYIAVFLQDMVNAFSDIPITGPHEGGARKVIADCDKDKFEAVFKN